MRINARKVFTGENDFILDEFISRLSDDHPVVVKLPEELEAVAIKHVNMFTSIAYDTHTDELIIGE